MLTKTVTHSYPLTLAKENQTVRVAGIIGGKNLLRRLLAMGISDNTELMVIRRHYGLENGMVICCGENRWALSSGIAHKILVTDSGDL